MKVFFSRGFLERISRDALEKSSTILSRNEKGFSRRVSPARRKNEVVSVEKCLKTFRLS